MPLATPTTSKSFMSLKEQKEAFVTGHEGTTPWEVLLVLSSAPLGLACFQTMFPYVRNNRNKMVALLVEAITIWFPLVLCQTNYLYPQGVTILGIQGLVFVLGNILIARGILPRLRVDTNTSPSARQHLDYLTAYRATLLFMTFISILAVDFHVFPRRFAKTEVYGYGWMDIGAASFALSAGIVSPRARGKRETLNVSKHMLHTLPLVILGIARILTNKGLEYQEHVTEYGIHWNFFFTLGVLALVPPFVLPPGIPPLWGLPLGILVGYQIALSMAGLQEGIETAPRDCFHVPGASMFCDFFNANREGILGCFGYLALYFMGECIGYSFVWFNNNNNLLGGNGLWKLSALLLGIWLFLTRVLELPVSRRSTNAPFCVWVAAINVVCLSSFQSLTVQKGKMPIGWDTVNRYGLVMFLIANLLTGFVNLTIPTLEVEDGNALLIIFAYICAVSLASLLLDWLWKKLPTRKVKRG